LQWLLGSTVVSKKYSTDDWARWRLLFVLIFGDSGATRKAIGNQMESWLTMAFPVTKMEWYLINIPVGFHCYVCWPEKFHGQMESAGHPTASRGMPPGTAAHTAALSGQPRAIMAAQTESFGRDEANWAKSENASFMFQRQFWMLLLRSFKLVVE
jgi:hypothetical protein